MKAVLFAAVILLAGAAVIIQQRSIAALKQAQAARETEAAALQAKVDEAAAKPQFDPDEVTRLRQEHDELIKLRGEVSALRKEKEDLEKKMAAANAAAAKAAARAAATPEPAPVQPPPNPAATPGTLAAQLAGIKHKLMTNQPLTEADRALVASIRTQVAELEKTPAAFASYQSSYIASLLGWKNDPRAQQLERMFTGATQAAQNRGLTFNAPGQIPETWTDAQNQLNNRVTGGVKNLLNENEKAVLDAALPAVMSAEIGGAPRPQ